MRVCVVALVVVLVGCGRVDEQKLLEETTRADNCETKLGAVEWRAQSCAEYDCDRKVMLLRTDSCAPVEFSAC